MENLVPMQNDNDGAAIAATADEVARTSRFARRAAAVCLVAALPVGLVAYDIATPKAALARVTDSAISAAALLKGRSPGARSSQLLLTKAKRSLAASDGIGRRSRMLPTGKEATESTGANRSIPRDISPESTTELTPASLPLDAPQPGFAPAAAGPESAPLGVSGPAGFPGIVSPSILDTLAAETPTPTPTPTTTTPATTAVPEPATWLSMIMGFGLIGIGLRRRKISALRAG